MLDTETRTQPVWSQNHVDSVSCLQPVAANPGRSITEAEIHLSNPRNLFRQTEPSLNDLADAKVQRVARAGYSVTVALVEWVLVSIF
ncbi:MAG: hypothetical protein B7Y90_15290 [Alphaproteobacteria bacterium 32-64-14]|nr:MAG: hypothetical protein B7Y90_15290 [Alphaproteobacteria bacterium 32-64-14]